MNGPLGCAAVLAAAHRIAGCVRGDDVGGADRGGDPAVRVAGGQEDRVDTRPPDWCLSWSSPSSQLVIFTEEN